MKIKVKVKVTDADQEDVLCESLQEVEQAFRNLRDNGVVTDDGGASSAWIMEIVKV